MKNFRLTVIAALLALSASQAAFAQAPGAPGAPYTGAPDQTGAAGAAANQPQADTGAVTNATTTTTTTTTNGISPDPNVEIVAVEGSEVASTLTDTGGEPVLMTLAGLALAMSALAFRRKVSA